MSDKYFDLIVETYRANKSGKSSKIHVRPIPGQVFSSEMDVECSREMRKNYPIGTKFKIRAKMTDKEGGASYLYSSYKWDYEVIRNT